MLENITFLVYVIIFIIGAGLLFIVFDFIVYLVMDFSIICWLEEKVYKNHDL